MLCGREHEDRVCPSCAMLLAIDSNERDRLDPRMVMPVPAGAWAPLSRTLKKSICYDCAAAEALHTFMGPPVKPGGTAMSFAMMRVVTGQDRLERLRLPGVRIGVSSAPVSCEGDLERLYEWQDCHGLNEEYRDAVRGDAWLEAGQKVT